MSSRAEMLYRQIAALSPTKQTAYVEGWLRARASETEYLDFKRVGDPSKTQQTWSQALSGFANTEGGILVWGIGTDRVKTPDGSRRIDVAAELKPVANTSSHVQFLKDHLVNSTVEPVQGVEFLEVAASGEGGGYVLCLIPEGRNKPHRDERSSVYWQRVGDNFLTISHSFLRSLFYPRAHPSFTVSIFWSGTWSVTISIINKGRGSADSAYLLARYKSPDWKIIARPPSRLVLERGLVPHEGEGHMSAVECPFPIHPEQHVECASINFHAVKEVHEFHPLSLVVYSRDTNPVSFEVDEINTIKRGRTEPLILNPTPVVAP